jgi:hypothetical protein
MSLHPPHQYRLTNQAEISGFGPQGLDETLFALLQPAVIIVLPAALRKYYYVEEGI